eukprot:g38.t1
MDELCDRLASALKITDVKRLNDIKALLYADDVALIAHSRTELQKMVNVVAKFAEDYRLEVNLKPGKTEIMPIYTSSKAKRPSIRERGEIQARYRLMCWNQLVGAKLKYAFDVWRAPVCSRCKFKGAKSHSACQQCGQKYAEVWDGGGSNAPAPGPDPTLTRKGSRCTRCGLIGAPGRSFCHGCGLEYSKTWEAPTGAPGLGPDPSHAKGEKCSRCGLIGTAGRSFCHSCGQKYSETWAGPNQIPDKYTGPDPTTASKGAKCSRCGLIGAPGRSFCHSCGCKYESEDFNAGGVAKVSAETCNNCGTPNKKGKFCPDCGKAY